MTHCRLHLRRDADERKKKGKKEKKGKREKKIGTRDKERTTIHDPIFPDAAAYKSHPFLPSRKRCKPFLNTTT